MQIKQQQSIVGLLICARSWVKFPKVLRDVHRAIREKSDLGWCRRGEESAALKDGNGCQLFTVKLILSSLPSAIVYGRVAAVSSPCVSMSKEILCKYQKLCYNSMKATVFTAIRNPKVMDGTNKK